jgi:hypothetical protein
MWYDFKNYIGNKLVKFIAKHCCLYMDTFYEICGKYSIQTMKAYIEYKELLMEKR